MRTNVCISLLLVAELRMQAQHPSTWGKTQYHNLYVLVSPYASELFYKNYEGNISASFPYQSLNVNTGVLSNQTYNTSGGNLFAKDHYTTGIEIEAGSKFFGVAKVGGMGYLATEEGCLGFGYNLFFSDKKPYKKSRYYINHDSEKNFVLKFSISLAENQYTQHLDCIDNTNKNIYRSEEHTSELQSHLNL